VRRCRVCRKRVSHWREYVCPRCGYFDRKLWWEEHPFPHIAKHLTLVQIIAEYREGGWSPPASLVARVQGREAAA
jgi:predicted amidophosphoribosyltransferase